MKHNFKTLVAASAVLLSSEAAQAGQWEDYNHPPERMMDELSVAECYSHSIAMEAEGLIGQEYDRNSTEGLLLNVFGLYARGIYLEQYRALRDLADIENVEDIPQEAMTAGQGALYQFHEAFYANAEEVAGMFDIDEEAIRNRCTNNPASYFPDL